MEFILIQLIGAIAFFALVGSYYLKEKKNILFMHIVAYVMFTIHYYLLSGITGAICNAIGLLALLAIYIIEKQNWKNKNLVAFVFIFIICIINIATFQNVFSIFPMIASIIVIVSFLMDNENYIRVIGLISAVCWLIYAIVYKSYISIGFEVFTIIGTLIALAKNTKKTMYSDKK